MVIAAANTTHPAFVSNWRLISLSDPSDCSCPHRTRPVLHHPTVRSRRISAAVASAVAFGRELAPPRAADGIIWAATCHRRFRRAIARWCRRRRLLSSRPRRLLPLLLLPATCWCPPLPRHLRYLLEILRPLRPVPPPPPRRIAPLRRLRVRACPTSSRPPAEPPASLPIATIERRRLSSAIRPLINLRAV